MTGCKVTAIVKGRREDISKELSKSKAQKFSKRLKEEMKIAVPKYQFAKKIKVEC